METNNQNQSNNDNEISRRAFLIGAAAGLSILLGQTAEKFDSKYFGVINPIETLRNDLRDWIKANYNKKLKTSRDAFNALYTPSVHGLSSTFEQTIAYERGVNLKNLSQKAAQISINLVGGDISKAFVSIMNLVNWENASNTNPSGGYKSKILAASGMPILPLWEFARSFIPINSDNRNYFKISPEKQSSINIAEYIINSAGNKKLDLDQGDLSDNLFNLFNSLFDPLGIDKYKTDSLLYTMIGYLIYINPNEALLTNKQNKFLNNEDLKQYVLNGYNGLPENEMVELKKILYQEIGEIAMASIFYAGGLERIYNEYNQMTEDLIV